MTPFLVRNLGGGLYAVTYRRSGAWLGYVVNRPERPQWAAVRSSAASGGRNIAPAPDAYVHATRAAAVLALAARAAYSGPPAR